MVLNKYNLLGRFCIDNDFKYTINSVMFLNQKILLIDGTR